MWENGKALCNKEMLHWESYDNIVWSIEEWEALWTPGYLESCRVARDFGKYDKRKEYWSTFGNTEGNIDVGRTLCHIRTLHDYLKQSNADACSTRKPATNGTLFRLLRYDSILSQSSWSMAMDAIQSGLRIENAKIRLQITISRNNELSTLRRVHASMFRA